MEAPKGLVPKFARKPSLHWSRKRVPGLQGPNPMNKIYLSSSIIINSIVIIISSIIITIIVIIISSSVINIITISSSSSSTSSSSSSSSVIIFNLNSQSKTLEVQGLVQTP